MMCVLVRLEYTILMCPEMFRLHGSTTHFQNILLETWFAHSFSGYRNLFQKTHLNFLCVVEVVVELEDISLEGIQFLVQICNT